MDVAVNPHSVLIKTDDCEWIPLVPGNYMKPLRISEESGLMVLLMRIDAGTTNARHRHIGPAEFFVLSGCVEYRGGAATGGSYIYEGPGEIHEGTYHPVDTVQLAHIYGPSAILDEEDNIIGIFDYKEALARVAEFQAPERAIART